LYWQRGLKIGVFSAGYYEQSRCDNEHRYLADLHDFFLQFTTFFNMAFMPGDAAYGFDI
jgi:hypothetical protein